jgi:hypothetical protein
VTKKEKKSKKMDRFPLTHRRPQLDPMADRKRPEPSDSGQSGQRRCHRGKRGHEQHLGRKPERHIGEITQSESVMAMSALSHFRLYP